MRLRTVAVALMAVLALAIGGGVLAFRAVQVIAAADGDGIAHAIAGVMRNGLSALDGDDDARIRSASAPAQGDESDAGAGDEPDAAGSEDDGSDANTAPYMGKRMMKRFGPVHLGMAFGGLPEGFETEPGVLVAALQTDGPAATAGLSRGDIIVGLDGEPIDTLADLHAALAERQAGQVVTLEVEHGDERLTIDVTLGDRDGSAWLGIAPCGGMHAMPGAGIGLPPIAIELHGLGAHIVELEPDGPAEAAGVEAGEVIRAVDGVEIGPENDLAEVLAGYAPGDTVTLTLARPVHISLGDEGDDVQSDEAAPGVDAGEPGAETDGAADEMPERDVAVTLGAHPDDPERAFLGVRYGMRMIHGPGDVFEFELDPESMGLPEGFDIEKLHERFGSEDGPAYIERFFDGSGGAELQWESGQDGPSFRFFRGFGPGPSDGDVEAVPARPLDGGTL